MRNHLLLPAALLVALLTSSPTETRAQPGLNAPPVVEGLRTDRPSAQQLEETPGTSLGDLAARIRVPYVATVSPLRQAITRAHEWLGEPACRRVFSDFEDQSGKLLSDVLGAREAHVVALGPRSAELVVEGPLSAGALQDRLAAVPFEGFRLEPVRVRRDRVELRVASLTR